MKSLTEKRAFSKELDSLSGALAKKQYKLEQTVGRLKQERKQFNKARRDMEKCESQKQDQIDYLLQRIEDMKKSEENLVNDLMQQQRIAKEALKALDNLTDRFEEDKKETKREMERQREEVMRREREKCDIKVNSLVAVNESLNERIKSLEAGEKSFLAQIDQMQAVYSQRQAEISDEGRETQRAAVEQQRAYHAQINELKVQLRELEDQTRLKYDEVAMSRNEISLLEQTHRQKHEAAQQRIRELAAKLADTERELSSCREKCAAKGREIELLNHALKERDALHSSQRERIEQKLQKREEEESFNKTKWNETYSKLSQEIMSLRNEIGGLRSEKEPSSPASPAKRRSTALAQLAATAYSGSAPPAEYPKTMSQIPPVCLPLFYSCFRSE